MRKSQWHRALARADVRLDSAKGLSGRCGRLTITVELQTRWALSLRDEASEGLLGLAGYDVRPLVVGHAPSHEVSIRIAGLAGGITVLAAPGATSSAKPRRAADGDGLQIGDPRFDQVAVVHGSPALVRALFDPPTRREFGALIGGRVTLDDGREEQTIQADATLAEGTLRVVIRDGRNRECVLRPLLTLARRLVEPLDLAERIARNTAGEPLPAVRLGNLQVLIAKFRDHPATHDTLVAALNDPADEVRLLGASALGSRGVRTLFKIALGKDSRDRHAAEAIAVLADRFLPRHARWALRRGIPARRTRVVNACLDRLVTAGDERSVFAVASALWSSDDEIVEAAARALGKTTLACFEETLIKALRHRLADVQCCAAIALGRVGSVASFAALRAWESGNVGDQSVAAAARQAIATLRSRLSDAVAGELSIADAGAGQVSLAEEDQRGQVSLEESGA